jgi:hypothetical protein
MGMENKTNFIVAIRGYKILKKETKANFTDVTAMDSLNNKVLLRLIEPKNNECIGSDAVKNITEFIKTEDYNQGILVSNRFTENAVVEMIKQKIQRVSDDYMPPFEIEELYSAIVNCANNQCNKKCGKTQEEISECDEKKVADICRIKTLGKSAKSHFDQGSVGLLKNDLKTALALNSNHFLTETPQASQL